MTVKFPKIPPQKPSPPKTTFAQQKYLEGRLKTVARDAEYKEDEKPAEQVALEKEAARLQKKVRKWDSRQYRKEKEFKARLHKERLEVEQVILFATPEDALSLVIEFEKKFG